MNPLEVTRYLDEFPLVPSTEGFFDFITGKSKPKDNLMAKDLRKVLSATYGNSEWLAKFKTPEGPVKVKYDCLTQADPEKGFNAYKASKKEMIRFMHEGFEKFKTEADKYRVVKDFSKQDELIRNLAKIVKDYTRPEPETYTEREPIAKEAIPGIYRYLTTSTQKDDQGAATLASAINAYARLWYGPSAKYRKQLEAVDEELGVIAILVSDALLEFTAIYDPLDKTISHRLYKEALIRHVNASLS